MGFFFLLPFFSFSGFYFFFLLLSLFDSFRLSPELKTESLFRRKGADCRLMTAPGHDSLICDGEIPALGACEQEVPSFKGFLDMSSHSVAEAIIDSPGQLH